MGIFLWRACRCALGYSLCGLFPVVLNLRGAEAFEAVLGGQRLPADQLIDREAVALARFLDGQQTTPHRTHHFRLAAYDPTVGVGRREIAQGEWLAVRAGDIAARREREGGRR